MAPKEYSKKMKYFLDAVEEEGLWYAVDTFSKFDGIKDEHFHKLRESFIKAGYALTEYAESKCPDWEPGE